MKQADKNTVEANTKGRSRTYNFDVLRKPGIFAITAAWIVRRLDDINILIKYELEQAEPFVWFLGALLLGVILYFQAPQEPNFVFLLIMVVGFAFATWKSRADGLRTYALAGITLLLLGVCLTSIHTVVRGGSTIRQEAVYKVNATVARVEVRHDGSRRLILDELEAERPTDNRVLPKRVRVSLIKRDLDLVAGDHINALIKLRPLPGPVIPGGYDFGRALYFEGIEATGFIFGSPEITGTTSRIFSLEDFLQNVRAGIAKRVRETFQSFQMVENGAIANALIVGERGGITPEARDVLARTGLAHILAISGLHMALVVGGALFLMRFILAVNPRVAITRPTKKIAAFVGLSVGIIYFSLSGGSVSATRAFVMVGIITLGVLLGARAFSIRNLAVAAFIIVLIKPDEVVKPGFQMSFAAALALITMMSLFLKSEQPWIESKHTSSSKRLTLAVLKFFWGIAAASIIAGAASGLFAAFHFYKIAPLGLFANLAAMPIFSLIVMPAGFLTLLFLPLGIEHYSLFIMDIGITWIVKIAYFFDGLSGHSGTVGTLKPGSFFGIAFIFVLMCVLKTRLRLGLLFPALLVLAFGLQKPLPDIFISEDGKTVAVRQSSGEGPYLLISGLRSGKFEAKVWLDASRLSHDRLKSSLGDEIKCDPQACIVKAGTLSVSHVKHVSAFAEDCRRADVVVSPLKAPDYCQTTTMLVVDADALKKVALIPSCLEDERHQKKISTSKRHYHVSKDPGMHIKTKLVD